MPSKISPPVNIKSSGISFYSSAAANSSPFIISPGNQSISVPSINSNENTPIAPRLQGQSSNDPFVIATVPRGPDGDTLTRGGSYGNSYRPKQTAPRYSSELINQITNNKMPNLFQEVDPFGFNDILNRSDSKRLGTRLITK